MSHTTRGSNKRRREEEQARHVAETSEVADHLVKWIMLHTSERPDDFVTEDALLSIMGKFEPDDDMTIFLKRYHYNLTDNEVVPKSYPIYHTIKLLRCHGAKEGVKKALTNLARARRELDKEIRNYVKELKAPGQ
jgi:RecG-like helicase